MPPVPYPRAAVFVTFLRKGLQSRCSYESCLVYREVALEGAVKRVRPLLVVVKEELRSPTDDAVGMLLHAEPQRAMSMSCTRRRFRSRRLQNDETSASERMVGSLNGTFGHRTDYRS